MGESTLDEDGDDEFELPSLLGGSPGGPPLLPEGTPPPPPPSLALSINYSVKSIIVQLIGPPFANRSVSS